MVLLFRALLFGLLAAATVSAQAVASPPADMGPPGAAGANVLRVVVRGVRSAEGHVRVDVCSASDFLKDCRYSGAAPARRGDTVVVIPGLPPGAYAVQAYHDRNDNNSVDRNILGVPTEGVGFSNDPPLLRAPNFKSASFYYGGGEQTVSLKLRHFFP